MRNDPQPVTLILFAELVAVGSLACAAIGYALLIIL